MHRNEAVDWCRCTLKGCCSGFTTSWTPNFGLRLFVRCSCRSVFVFCRVDRVDSAEGGREARADSARQVCQPGDTGPAHRQRQGTRCLCHSGQATPSSLTDFFCISTLLDFSYSPLIRYGTFISAQSCPHPPSPLSRIGSVWYYCPILGVLSVI
jgi:hypothetical protein